MDRLDQDLGGQYRVELLEHWMDLLPLPFTRTPQERADIGKAMKERENKRK